MNIGDTIYLTELHKYAQPDWYQKNSFVLCKPLKVVNTSSKQMVVDKGDETFKIVPHKDILGLGALDKPNMHVDKGVFYQLYSSQLITESDVIAHISPLIEQKKREQFGNMYRSFPAFSEKILVSLKEATIAEKKEDLV